MTEMTETVDIFSMNRETNEIDVGVSLDIVHGDITTREVDVIVNAAHTDLTGGGGVDGAIHNAAGQKLLGECLQLYGCAEGEARITCGYDLPAKYIIHTVGPVWTPNKENQEDAKKALANCYKNCLEIAERQGLKSIAFPCISTGAYCFPKDIAAEIAIKTIYSWASRQYGGSYLSSIDIVCFTEGDMKYYKDALEKEKEDRTFPKCHRTDYVVCSYHVAGECRFRAKCWMDSRDENPKNYGPQTPEEFKENHPEKYNEYNKEKS